jgi:preprotein translocase subunit SecB
VLKVEVSAKSDQGVHFLIDLSYAGLFGLRNIPEDALPPFLLMEAPRLIFPFARQIISDASQQMGFPALMLDPIDFSQAYSAQIDAMQAQAEGAETNGNAAPQQSVTDAPAEDE